MFQNMISNGYSISCLPPEIISQLFSYLGPRDLASCAQVSNIWRRLAQDRIAHGDPHFCKYYKAWVEVVKKERMLKAESEGRVYREIGDRTPCSTSEWVQLTARFLFEKIWQSDDLRKQLDEEIKKLKIEREVYLSIRKLFGEYSRFENLPILHHMTATGFYIEHSLTQAEQLPAPVMRGQYGYRITMIALKIRFEPRSEESGPVNTTTMVYMNVGKTWLLGGPFRSHAPFVGKQNCYDTIRALLTLGKVEVDDDYKGEGLRLLGTYRIVS